MSALIFGIGALDAVIAAQAAVAMRDYRRQSRKRKK